MADGAFGLGDFGSEWPKKAADAVDQGVNLVRDRVVRPIIVGARGFVFGLLLATLAITTLVFVSVALVRICTVFIFHNHVWASYLLVGTVFSGIGYYFWRQRAPRAS